MPRSAGTQTAVLTAALALLGGTAALAADVPAGLPVDVKVTVDGPVLVTPAGMTLYYVTNEDTKSEKFSWQCTNVPPRVMTDQQSGVGDRPVPGGDLVKSCVQKWPVFVADANAKPVGDFTVVQRPEGIKQWAYRGFPLYSSVKDRAPGERNAAGIGNLGGGPGRGGFSIATFADPLPPGVGLSRREEGLVLMNVADSKPIYTPRGGARPLRVSVGSQLTQFDTLRAPGIVQVSGDWSVIDAGTGRKQYAFRGKPLYSAPASMSEMEIAETGGWDPVVVQKGFTRPAEIGKQLSLLGEVYTEKSGHTLYLYSCNAGTGAGGARVMAVACDDAGDPATYMVALCGNSKACATRWRPYIAPANARPAGDWSIVDITYPMFTNPRGALYPSDAPKVKAWAYRGKPVFTFNEDEKPGDIVGDGTKGLWGSNFSALLVPGRAIGD